MTAPLREHSPPPERAGILQWHRFDGIARQGREHAVQVLDAPGPEGLAGCRGAAP